MLGVNLYEDRGEGGSIIKYNFLKVVLIFNNNSIIFDIIFSPQIIRLIFYSPNIKATLLFIQL